VNGFSQKYNTLGGIRVGDDFGISFSQRIANKNTIEIFHQPGTFAGQELTCLLVKQHYPLLTKRFNFFIGAGAYTRRYYPAFEDEPPTERKNGIAFSLGAEISLGRLSIATDFIPLATFSRSESNRRFSTTSGFSLRYIIVPRSSGFKKFFQNLFKKK
jgi:hypothetical protein